jgi:4-hydroxy-tetrahydrodipicolinate reductase
VTRIVVLGAAGRMGRAVAETAAANPGFQVKAGVDRAPRPGFWDSAWGWGADLGTVVSAGDVVVEFSSPEGAAAAAATCAARGVPLVSGSTGHSKEQDEALRRAAASVAIMAASNFSLGVLALRRGLRAVLSAIPDWDVEVVERHHRAKKDSPSGTALALVQDVEELRPETASSLRHGRVGKVGPRPPAEIGVHAVRGGTWVGDHAVLVAGDGEWLELRHVAQDRTAFARGALAAADFVAKAPPGLYTFEAVLNATVR